MTISGITTGESTRDVIISSALRKIGVLAKGQSPDAEDLANGQHALNALMMEYQTYGLPLWKRQQYNLTLTVGQNTYVLGSGATNTTGIGWDGNVSWDGGILWDSTTSTGTIFPLKIEQIIVRRNGGSAHEVFSISNSSFNLLNTTSTGMPNQYAYQPKINTGTLKLWPTPDYAYTLEITHRNQVSLFTGSSETPDFPQEWTNALVYGLAVLLAPEYGVPLQDRSQLMKEAEKRLDMAKDFDFENTSLYFQIRKD